jgi:hypothetical protein
MSPDDPFSDPKKPVSGSFLKQAQNGRILSNGRNKRFTKRPFPARFRIKTGFCMIPEKDAEKRPL